MKDEMIGVLLAIAMLGAWYLGTRFGRRLHNNQHNSPQFDSPAMALLGLLLAFAFGTSMSKHDQRRIAVVQDSNAIGDFYTCATLLKEPVRTQLQSVIRGYAEQRLAVVSGKIDEAKLASALAEFDRTHARMTVLVNQALANGTPIAVSLTNTLNAVTSNQASRLAAIRDRLPGSVLVLLCAASIVTALLIGRNQGFSGTSDLPGVLAFVVLVSLTVYVTLDLNRPERGFITVSQEPIERLVSSMSK